MKPSELIQSLEQDAENLERLCGEVLATLTVNMERINIYFVTTDAKKEFQRLLDAWWSRYKRYRVGISADELPPRESPFHAYLCVQHGGSPRCEEENRRMGMTCPKCQIGEATEQAVRFVQGHIE